MKEMNNTSIYRLNTILTLFQAERASYSVRDIARLLGVPKAVIRKDIVMLHNNRECETIFFPDDEELDMDDDLFLKKIESGEFDDTELTAETGFRDDVYVSLSQLELSCLNEFLDGNRYSKGQMHKNYVTKPMYNQARANMQVKVAEMNQLIMDEETITIEYHAKDGRISTFDMRPLVIVDNAMDDLYYVVTIQDGRLAPFRLDRIYHYEIAKDKIDIEDRTPLKQLANIWGMEMGPSYHVKLMILNEARVQDKIRKELAGRTNAEWTQDGDILYFEDEVIGINNFRSWVNSYGSSVLVIEPKSLRDEIIESAKKRLAFYNV